MVKHADVLKAIYTILSTDATISSLVGTNISNQPPQDGPVPHIRFRWGGVGEWDTKSSHGYEGTIFVDVWTQYSGDLKTLEIADAVDDALHLSTLSLISGQSVLVRHQSMDTFIEPDNETHRSVQRFTVLVTEEL